jgi:hypothetical protein
LDWRCQSHGSNLGGNWYQQQLALATKYGSADFHVLAHVGLANIGLLQGLTQISLADQSKNLQNAYEHIKQAWMINKDFGDEESEVMEPNELVQLLISITDEFIKMSNVNLAP